VKHINRIKINSEKFISKLQPKVEAEEAQEDRVTYNKNTLLIILKLIPKILKEFTN
jgi:hypothetical protein